MLPAPPLNGDGHTWHHGDGTLYTYVSRGGKFYDSPGIPSFKSGMPSFRPWPERPVSASGLLRAGLSRPESVRRSGFGEILSREEIITVIKYLKSPWGDKLAEGFGLMKGGYQALASENDPFPPAAP